MRTATVVVVIIAVLVVGASGTALAVVLFLNSGDKPAHQTLGREMEGLLLMRPAPGFLGSEPEIRRFDKAVPHAAARVEYQPAHSGEPFVILDEFPLTPLTMDFEPQNPIQWRLPYNDATKLQYRA